MSKWNPIERIKEADKSTVGKWVCLIGAGILGLFANLFDTRHKDQLYEKKLDQTIAEQAKRLSEEKAA